MIQIKYHRDIIDNAHFIDSLEKLIYLFKNNIIILYLIIHNILYMSDRSESALIDKEFNCGLIDKCYYFIDDKLHEINKKFDDEVGNRLFITKKDIYNTSDVVRDDDYLHIYNEYIKYRNSARSVSQENCAKKINDTSCSFKYREYGYEYNKINDILSDTNITNAYFYGVTYDLDQINLSNLRTIRIGQYPSNFSFDKMKYITNVILYMADIYYCDKYPKYLFIHDSAYRQGDIAFVIKTKQPLGPKNAMSIYSK